MGKGLCISGIIPIFEYKIEREINTKTPYYVRN